MHPHVARLQQLPNEDLVLERRTWPERMREAYDERAAVMEVEGGLPRAHAEREATLAVLAEEYARRDAELCAEQEARHQPGWRAPKA